jgi:hypothetical protein
MWPAKNNPSKIDFVGAEIVLAKSKRHKRNPLKTTLFSITCGPLEISPMNRANLQESPDSSQTKCRETQRLVKMPETSARGFDQRFNGLVETACYKTLVSDRSLS